MKLKCGIQRRNCKKIIEFQYNKQVMKDVKYENYKILKTKAEKRNKRRMYKEMKWPSWEDCSKDV